LGESIKSGQTPDGLGWFQAFKGIEPFSARGTHIRTGDLKAQYLLAAPPSDHIPLGGAVRFGGHVPSW
jgi:hypothetical protein